MNNDERRPADLLQLLPTERIFSETKQTQETEEYLKLSLGGIYEDPIKEKTLERSSSVAEVQNDENIPRNVLSSSRSCSLPSSINKNIGDLQSLYDRVLRRNAYPNRQLCLGYLQGSDLRSPGCVLQRNSIPSYGHSFEAAKREGRANAISHLRPILPRLNRKPEFGSNSNQSTTSTQINGFPKSLMKSPSTPTELKNNVERLRPENSQPEFISYSNGSTSSTLTNGSPMTPAELRNIVNREHGPTKKPKLVITEDNVETILRSMPSVTARGDGRRGKRIEGFLYKCSTTEEVSIVCICHGRFLTPAEFVEHAGGKNVDDPMTRITVLGVSF